MILDTAVGPVEASRLVTVTKTQEVSSGVLVSKEFYLDGALVKCDQTLDVNQETFDAAFGAVGRIRF